MKALEVKGLVKKYKDNEVLKSIDLDIEEGDFFALLGHNGAGKTTTIGILTDLVTKDSGNLKVFGIDIDKDFSAAKKLIGVVPQEYNINIFYKVKDIPVFQAGFYGIPKKIAVKRTEKYLKKLGLWEKRDAEARELSGGMKRRLMIVRALVHEPKFLILDEPTAGVDVELRKSMRDFIIELNKSGITILLTTHYLEEVEELCNKVAILNKGNIIENTTTKKLLKKLDEEVVVLTLKDNLSDGDIDSNFQKKYKAKMVSENEMQISIFDGCILNEIFSDLDELKIHAESFRNKSSRLEQLFIKLTSTQW